MTNQRMPDQAARQVPAPGPRIRAHPVARLGDRTPDRDIRVADLACEQRDTGERVGLR
jgi:hypothetical protein